MFEKFMQNKVLNELDKAKEKLVVAIDDCLSPLNGWTKFEIQFSHLNLGLCQEKGDSFL